MKAPLIAAICPELGAQNVIRLDWPEVDTQARMITVRINSRKRGGELAIPIAQPRLVELGEPQGRGRRNPRVSYNSRIE
jgi:hypothetical protein